MALIFALSLSGLFFVYLGSVYLELFQQFIIAWGLLGLLMIFNKIETFKKAPLRIIFILMGAFISLRYLFWRTFSSLIYTGPLDWVAMMLLYFAEVYCMTVHFIGLFSALWPMTQKIVPLPEDLSLFPTVDILIPTYNESEEIVRITATASVQIDYPKDKLRITILDDGSTVAKRNNPETSRAAWQRYYQLKRMARELGVHYITREENVRAKAGNINHALKHTNGDLVLILDCDHVPTRDILKNMAGWFLKDKKLFLIQTPHFFINPDPIEKNLNTFSNAPSENEMFYRGVHASFDFWNSSYFCGSAALLRRKYLKISGGIAGDTITEDAETSLYLHNKGYNSIFIDRPMICGLSPETFDSFIVQRSRWAQGMVQIFILKNPLFAKGLKMYQRLCYFNSCLFWFFGFSRFIFYVAPISFLLFGLQIYHASLGLILAYAVPHILISFVLTDFLYGKYRWPLFSELYESVQSIILIPPVLSVLRNPRSPTFTVTAKGGNVDASFLNPFAVPLYIMFLLTLIAIPVAVFKWYNYPLFRDAIAITFTWCLFNLFMLLASLGAFWDRKQVRRYHRIWSKGKINVFFPRMKKAFEGEIKDVSLTGIGFEVSLPFIPVAEEDVVLETRDSYGEKYQFNARMFRHIKKGKASFCGCDFVTNDETYAKIVRFVYGDSQRWMDFWDKKSVRTSFGRVALYLIQMGFKGSKESFVGLYHLFVVMSKKYLYPLWVKIKRQVVAAKSDLPGSA